jgi:hypothetical protein
MEPAEPGDMDKARRASLRKRIKAGMTPFAEGGRSQGRRLEISAPQKLRIKKEELRN